MQREVTSAFGASDTESGETFPLDGAPKSVAAAVSRQPRVFPGSPNLDGVADDRGMEWTTFRRGLRPSYAVVWRHIGIGFAALFGLYGLHGIVSYVYGNRLGLLLAPLFGALIGYALAGLTCFKHEAAHYNLHPHKSTNDFLANLLFCPAVAEDIAQYRAVHWQHHLALGTPEDTEVSYHDAPTPRFFFRALTGLHALDVFSRYRRRAEVRSEAAPLDRRMKLVATGRALLYHGSMIGTPLLFGLYAPAVAWLIAALIFFPLFGALRQLLEHRSSDARPGVDYTVVAHGAVNRMFGSDLLSRTFGAAGFNRHLLHHWYPTASYTNFDQLEDFLMHTKLAPQIDDARTSYRAALRLLAARAR